MGNRQWRQLLIGVLCIGLLGSTFASAQGVGTGYDRGYREGVQQGEQDGRQGREPQVERNSRYRDADRATKADTATATCIETNSGAAMPPVTAPGTTGTASTSTTKVDATIAATLASFADIRIRRSRADTVTGGTMAPTIDVTAIATTRSATATIATAMMGTPGPTARRMRTRTTIEPASGRATRRATGTVRGTVGRMGGYWPRAGRSG